MWAYKSGNESTPRQLINLDSVAALQSERDRAFGTSEDKRRYQVIAYYKTDDFLHQTHSYMKLTGNLSKDGADALVAELYDAMRRGERVFELPDDGMTQEQAATQHDLHSIRHETVGVSRVARPTPEAA